MSQKEASGQLQLAASGFRMRYPAPKAWLSPGPPTHTHTHTHTSPGTRLHLGLRVQAADHGVQPRGQLEVVKCLALFTDRILRINACALHVAWW